MLPSNREVPGASDSYKVGFLLPFKLEIVRRVFFLHSSKPFDAVVEESCFAGLCTANVDVYDVVFQRFLNVV